MFLSKHSSMAAEGNPPLTFLTTECANQKPRSPVRTAIDGTAVVEDNTVVRDRALLNTAGGPQVIEQDHFCLSLDPDHLPRNQDAGWVAGTREGEVDILLHAPEITSVTSPDFHDVGFKISFHQRSGVLMFTSCGPDGRVCHHTGGQWQVLLPGETFALIQSIHNIKVGHCEYNLCFRYPENKEEEKRFIAVRNLMLDIKDTQAVPELLPFFPLSVDMTKTYGNVCVYTYLTRGGFSHIYKGVDKTTGDLCVIKEMTSDSSGEKVELLQEVNLTLKAQV